MVRSRTVLVLIGASLAACADPGEPVPPEPSLPPANSSMEVRAVDAETGEALSDARMTVRYLVREPVTLDASAVTQVSSSDAYPIAHSVTSDSLIVEMRFEAASYERLDTVFAVAHGATGGAFEARLTPKPVRAATAAPRPSSTRTEPAAPPPTQPAADPDTNVDRTAMRQGDDAFNRQDWRGAAAAYRRMIPPRSTTSAYAAEYRQALVRLGIAAINVGNPDWAGPALQEAIDVNPADYTAYFYLGQVQCGQGQFTAGRQTLSEVERRNQTISADQRDLVLTLVEYQRALCSYGEFDAARSAAEVTRARQQALADFLDFVERAQRMPQPRPNPIRAALQDAQRRVNFLRGG